MTNEATPFVPPVTNEEAIEFLENACRNWAEFPVLSPPDIEDVAKSLTRFVRAAINRAEGHSLSQHCPNCEEQAGVIVVLRGNLHFVLDREADTQHRHDAKVEAQAAEIEKLREAVKMCLDELYAPDPNCSCHIRPPCNDCVDYSSIREVQDIARAALGETE